MKHVGEPRSNKARARFEDFFALWHFHGRIDEHCCPFGSPGCFPYRRFVPGFRSLLRLPRRDPVGDLLKHLEHRFVAREGQLQGGSELRAEGSYDVLALGTTRWSHKMEGTAPDRDFEDDVCQSKKYSFLLGTLLICGRPLELIAGMLNTDGDDIFYLRRRIPRSVGAKSLFHLAPELNLHVDRCRQGESADGSVLPVRQPLAALG